MITVIADDLTGAAEIAGLGWRHGLHAEILHRDEPPSHADLVVFDADSRNVSSAEARRRVTQILQRVQRRRPAWIYKKVDSVLRGNVVAEAEAALTALGLRRCLVVSANPAAGRIVRDGRYFIRGVPLDQTDFRHDPKHPRTSSDVLALLGPLRRWEVRVLPPSAKALPEGITIGAAASEADMTRWAGLVDKTVLTVGGAEFFAALLRKHGLRAGEAATRAEVDSAGPASVLFVCGSLAEASRKFIERGRDNGWPVLLLPKKLLQRRSGLAKLRDEWRAEVTAALRQYPRVIMGIGHAPVPGRSTPARLGRLLTETVAQVLSEFPPAWICVEGGATAALLMERLDCRRMKVERELQTGVNVLRPARRAGPMLVCKPGSYQWPEFLLVPSTRRPLRSRQFSCHRYLA